MYLCTFGPYRKGLETSSSYDWIATEAGGSVTSGLHAKVLLHACPSLSRSANQPHAEASQDNAAHDAKGAARSRICLPPLAWPPPSVTKITGSILGRAEPAIDSLSSCGSRTWDSWWYVLQGRDHEHDVHATSASNLFPLVFPLPGLVS